MALAVLLVLLLFASSVYVLFRDNLRRGADAELLSYAEAMEGAIEAETSLPRPPIGAGELGGVVFDEEGDVAAISPNFRTEFEGALDESSDEQPSLSDLPALATTSGTFVTVHVGDEDFRAWVHNAELDDDTWAIAALAPESVQTRALSDFLVVAGIALVAAVFVTGGIAWLVSGIAARPLARLRDEVHGLHEDALDTRISVPEETIEVAEVARAVNMLLERIDASLARERAFVADASHELRNPLAGLRGELELALMSPDPENLRAEVEEAISETDRLTRLADSLLLLARMEAGHEVNIRPMSLADTAGQVMIRQAPFAQKQNVELLLRGDDVTVEGEPSLVDRAVENLVQNAIRHAPEGTSVCIDLWKRTDTAGIDVTDEGEGVPSDQRERIFDRLTRVDGARNRQLGGAGLGLAIVRGIMTALNGSVSLESADGGRTTFRLTFPVAG